MAPVILGDAYLAINQLAVYGAPVDAARECVWSAARTWRCRCAGCWTSVPRATLAANQREFRAALAANLAAAGQPDADTRAGAIITACDGLIVHFLLYGQTRQPKDIARQAAAALASLGE